MGTGEHRYRSKNLGDEEVNEETTTGTKGDLRLEVQLGQRMKRQGKLHLRHTGWRGKLVLGGLSKYWNHTFTVNQYWAGMSVVLDLLNLELQS